jgi:hypothetical protein
VPFAPAITAACSAGSIRHRTSPERGHGCGKPRGRVIRLIHRHFGVSYFIQIRKSARSKFIIQIRKSARSKFITTGRLAPQLQTSEFCCAYKDPSRPRWGLFSLMLPRPQSSRLAEFGGRGISFKICRGTLGSLAMFTAMRNASSPDKRFIDICRCGSCTPVARTHLIVTGQSSPVAAMATLRWRLAYECCRPPARLDGLLGSIGRPA